MSYERALNFDQWKTFSKNCGLIMACLQIYREFLSSATFLHVHSNSKEVSYLSWQNAYPNLKTTCHMKLNFFLWFKVPEYLHLVKYLISVTVALNCLVVKSTETIQKRVNIYQPFVFRFCHSGTVSPRTLKMFIKIQLSLGSLWNCELVHTSRCSQYINYSR